MLQWKSIRQLMEIFVSLWALCSTKLGHISHWVRKLRQHFNSLSVDSLLTYLFGDVPCKFFYGKYMPRLKKGWEKLHWCTCEGMSGALERNYRNYPVSLDLQMRKSIVESVSLFPSLSPPRMSACASHSVSINVWVPISKMIKNYFFDKSDG